MRDIFTSSFACLYPIILLGLVGIVAIATGCESKPETERALEYAIQTELPIGAPRTEVEGFLIREQISHHRSARKPHPENQAGNGDLFGTITASVPVEDSVMYRNSRIYVVFYFDDDDRLVSYTTQFTFSSHP